MPHFANYLAIALSRIPSVLMSDENKHDYLTFSEHLPSGFAHSVFGFEKNLLSDAREMDMSVSAGIKGEYNFCSFFDFPALQEYISRSTEWKRLSGLAKKWNDPGSPMHNILEMVILEFDMASLIQEIPVPSVFFGIEKEPDPAKPGYDEFMLQRLNVIFEALEIVSGEKIQVPLKTMLQSLSRKSSGKYYLFQTGLMLSRKDSPVKVCIKRFSPKSIDEFILTVMDDTPVRTEILSVCSKFAPFFDELVLVFDIAGSEVKRAAIECYYHRKKQPPDEKRWKDIISTLINEGLCAKETGQAALDFPRKFLLYNFSKNSPEYHAQGLHHIKFITDGSNTAAKMYFWSGFHWKQSEF